MLKRNAGNESSSVQHWHQIAHTLNERPYNPNLIQYCLKKLHNVLHKNKTQVGIKIVNKARRGTTVVWPCTQKDGTSSLMSYFYILILSSLTLLE
jgi:hypothetical protein